MHPFLHACRTTFRRFAWEIAAFWLLCLVLICFCSSSLFISPPFHLPRPEARAGFVEVIAATWLTLRLIFSESKLLTQGSWRVRPLPGWAVQLAPFAILGGVLLPPLLLRAIVIQRSVAPDATQWSHILLDQFAPTVGIALALIVFGKVLAALAGQGRSRLGWGRKTALAAMLLGLGVAWFHPWGLSRPLMSLLNQEIGSYGSGGQNYGGDVPGIQDLLPKDSIYLGDWGPWTHPVDRRREVIRISLTPGAVTRQPGVVAWVSKCRTLERQLHLEIDFNVADRQLLYEIRNGTLVLHYPGNTYALPNSSLGAVSMSPFILPPQQTVRRGGLFPSPLGLPGNRQTWSQLLAGAELILYVPDTTGPMIVAPRPLEKEIRADTPLEEAVTQLFDQLDFKSDWGEKHEALKQQGRSLPAPAVPLVLAHHPWSDMTWSDFIRDFLLARVGEADKAALFARFATEPRLGEILVAKGWAAEAMPQLKRFAHDRLPLDAASLTALLKEKDPTLSADLAALVARLPEGVEELEPLLREQPGFDWPAFLHEGWMRRKYAFRWQTTPAPFDFWAAREGDAGAFRYLGEQAARGAPQPVEKLTGLLAEKPADPVAYLRENIDRVRFDPAAGQWGPP